MSKLLVFLLLCIASASCVELKNLCSSDHFEYNGTLVNAFFKIPTKITFPGLSHYLINSSVACDYSEFVEKTNFFEVLRIKKAFNRKFAEFYTNDLNGDTADKLEEKRFELSWNYWVPLYKIAKVEASACVQTFQRIAHSACSVFQTLVRFSKFNAYPIADEAGFKPTRWEAIKNLGRLFEKLNDAGDNQTFALMDERPFDVYNGRGLVLPREFKFLTEGSVQPDTETPSIVIYDQYLPFNSRQHTDEGCVPVEELPRFYKNKGKE